MYHRENRQSRHGLFLLKRSFAAVLFGTFMIADHCADNSVSYAQPAESNFPSSLVVGTITSVEASSIEIDRYRYKLAPNAAIKDEEDNEKEMTSIVPGAMAKARVKQGRIDQMVLILPK
jgi:hypothetical protein